MRFLCIYKPGKPEGVRPSQQEMVEMGKFIWESIKSGVPLATEGCLQSAAGARVGFSNGKHSVTVGPFTETKELIGGFAIIRRDSKQEAVEYTKRFLEVVGLVARQRFANFTRCLHLEPPMVSARQTAGSKVWVGRVISGLVVLFLLFDGITKVMKESHVMQAAAQLGLSEGAIVGIGTRLLACTTLSAIPRTSVLGATLLTGYLGGATATNLHARHSLFEALFPVGFGVLAWAGICMQNEGLVRRIGKWHDSTT